MSSKKPLYWKSRPCSKEAKSFLGLVDELNPYRRSRLIVFLADNNGGISRHKEFYLQRGGV